MMWIQNPSYSLPKGTLWVKYERHRAVGRETILWGLQDKWSHTDTMTPMPVFPNKLDIPVFILFICLLDSSTDIHLVYDTKIILPSIGLLNYLTELDKYI